MSNIMKNYENMWQAFVRPYRQTYSSHDLGNSTFMIQKQDKMVKIKRHDLTLNNKNLQNIQCSFYQFDDENSYPVVVYLHCNSGSRLEGQQYLQQLLELGVQLFVFDFQGCGLSDGEYISLGYYEVNDVETVIDYLKTHQKVEKIILWGRSMGAVTAIMYGAKIQDDQIQIQNTEKNKIVACIYDSPFYSLMKLAKEIAQQKTGLPSFIIVGALQLIKNTIISKVKFDISDLNLREYAQKNEIPALFLASQTDTFTKYTHSVKITEHYKAEKRLQYFDAEHNETRPRSLNLIIFEYIREKFNLEKLQKNNSQQTIPQQKNTIDTKIQSKQENQPLYSQKSQQTLPSYQVQKTPKLQTQITPTARINLESESKLNLVKKKQIQAQNSNLQTQNQGQINHLQLKNIYHHKKKSSYTDREFVRTNEHFSFLKQSTNLQFNSNNEKQLNENDYKKQNYRQRSKNYTINDIQTSNNNKKFENDLSTKEIQQNFNQNEEIPTIKIVKQSSLFEQNLQNSQQIKQVQQYQQQQNSRGNQKIQNNKQQNYVNRQTQSKSPAIIQYSNIHSLQNLGQKTLNQKIQSSSQHEKEAIQKNNHTQNQDQESNQDKIQNQSHQMNLFYQQIQQDMKQQNLTQQNNQIIKNNSEINQPLKKEQQQKQSISEQLMQQDEYLAKILDKYQETEKKYDFHKNALNQIQLNPQQLPKMNMFEEMSFYQHYSPLKSQQTLHQKNNSEISSHFLENNDNLQYQKQQIKMNNQINAQNLNQQLQFLQQNQNQNHIRSRASTFDGTQQQLQQQSQNNQNLNSNPLKLQDKQINLSKQYSYLQQELIPLYEQNKQFVKHKFQKPAKKSQENQNQSQNQQQNQNQIQLNQNLSSSINIKDSQNKNQIFQTEPNTNNQKNNQQQQNNQQFPYYSPKKQMLDQIQNQNQNLIQNQNQNQIQIQIQNQNQNQNQAGFQNIIQNNQKIYKKNLSNFKNNFETVKQENQDNQEKQENLPEEPISQFEKNNLYNIKDMEQDILKNQQKKISKEEKINQLETRNQTYDKNPQKNSYIKIKQISTSNQPSNLSSVKNSCINSNSGSNSNQNSYFNLSSKQSSNSNFNFLQKQNSLIPSESQNGINKIITNQFINLDINNLTQTQKNQTLNTEENLQNLSNEEFHPQSYLINTKNQNNNQNQNKVNQNNNYQNNQNQNNLKETSNSSNNILQPLQQNQGKINLQFHKTPKIDLPETQNFAQNLQKSQNSQNLLNKSNSLLNNSNNKNQFQKHIQLPSAHKQKSNSKNFLDQSPINYDSTPVKPNKVYENNSIKQMFFHPSIQKSFQKSFKKQENSKNFENSRSQNKKYSQQNQQPQKIKELNQFSLNLNRLLSDNQVTNPTPRKQQEETNLKLQNSNKQIQNQSQDKNSNQKISEIQNKNQNQNQNQNIQIQNQNIQNRNQIQNKNIQKPIDIQNLKQENQPLHQNQPTIFNQKQPKSPIQNPKTIEKNHNQNENHYLKNISKHFRKQSHGNQFKNPNFLSNLQQQDSGKNFQNLHASTNLTAVNNQFLSSNEHDEIIQNVQNNQNNETNLFNAQQKFEQNQFKLQQQQQQQNPKHLLQKLLAPTNQNHNQNQQQQNCQENNTPSQFLNTLNVSNNQKTYKHFNQLAQNQLNQNQNQNSESANQSMSQNNKPIISQQNSNKNQSLNLNLTAQINLSSAKKGINILYDDKEQLEELTDRYLKIQNLATQNLNQKLEENKEEKQNSIKTDNQIEIPQKSPQKKLEVIESIPINHNNLKNLQSINKNIDNKAKNTNKENQPLSQNNQQHNPKQFPPQNPLQNISNNTNNNNLNINNNNQNTLKQADFFQNQEKTFTNNYNQINNQNNSQNNNNNIQNYNTNKEKFRSTSEYQQQQISNSQKKQENDQKSQKSKNKLKISTPITLLSKYHSYNQNLNQIQNQKEIQVSLKDQDEFNNKNQKLNNNNKSNNNNLMNNFSNNQDSNSQNQQISQQKTFQPSQNQQKNQINKQIETQNSSQKYQFYDYFDKQTSSSKKFNNYYSQKNTQFSNSNSAAKQKQISNTNSQNQTQNSAKPSNHKQIPQISLHFQSNFSQDNIKKLQF
ncbi:hypothetical protein PPERSA_03547 [Pseudocohnilembus persalinus]|uniref:Serine aminopeptidase S33 domain-containing protein n=1 Tax=Pseudocohnilembus persalinus TaxID=266149 RepID=A0A0V0QPI2_PSEPJ|nr:hypothetical protein PPERSA_03547 [Pseudocohnilembus persalinus]|eukprot:KRX04307.1 hypothetical protein PPERSA_03547 [Pseudocohnilembus persalinus]